MKHVRICEHDVGALADRPPRILRRVAIVSKRAQIRAHLFDEAVQLVELILGERFGGEEVHRARPRFGGQAIQHGQVVAKRFPACSRRDDDRIGARGDVLVRFRLMGVQPFNPPPDQHFAQLGIQLFWEIGIFSGPCGSAADRPNRPVGIPRHALEFVEYRGQVAFGG